MALRSDTAGSIIVSEHSDTLFMVCFLIVFNIQFTDKQAYVNRCAVYVLFGVCHELVINGHRESTKELVGAIAHKLFRFFR